MALLDVENLVEHIRNMETQRWLWRNIALLGNLLVGEPTAVSEGVLYLIAVVELLLRAQARAHLWDFEFSDAYKLVADLLRLVVELCLVWEILPLATSADAKVLADRLTTLLRLVDKAHYPALHKATVLFGYLHINNIARNGHRHKYHHALVVSHRLALGCQSRNLQPLNKWVRSSFSCHKSLFRYLWDKDKELNGERKAEIGKLFVFRFLRVLGIVFDTYEGWGGAVRW